MIKVNISDLARLRQVTSAQIYRRGGVALRNAIEEEFKQLLIETPQYSGSTVASYRIGPGRSTPDMYEELPEPANANEAFQRGHMAAVNLAMNNNFDGLMAIENLESFKTQDLVIKNNSPQWEVTEYGPLREVNEPTGTFAEFVERLNNKIIDVDLGDL